MVHTQKHSYKHNMSVSYILHRKESFVSNLGRSSMSITEGQG